MPRPQITRADVNDHTRAWHDVEQLRHALDKSQSQFAAMLGVSEGRYSGWKHQGEMPADIWDEYQKIEVRVSSEQIHTNGDAPEAKRVIELPADTYVHTEALIPLLNKLKLERCDVEWCRRWYYQRTWNMRYCDRCRENGDARRWRKQRKE